MRKLLIFFAVLLLIVMGIWGTIVFMLDEERLKALAVEQVEQRTGRTLVLDGPLELKLFPRIAQHLRKIIASPGGRKRRSHRLRILFLSRSANGAVPSFVRATVQTAIADADGLRPPEEQMAFPPALHREATRRQGSDSPV